MTIRLIAANHGYQPGDVVATGVPGARLYGIISRVEDANTVRVFPRYWWTPAVVWWWRVLRFVGLAR